LEEIESAAKRAAGLTRQLLAFSRRDVVQPEVLEPAEVVQGLNKMLLRLIGEDVMLTVSLTPDAGRVRIDRGHLEQVIVNLVVNARDAMPQGGKLHLEVAPTILDDGYAEAHPGCEPGPHVMVAVSDTGCGMSKEVQARLFEPFFTTKPVGRGTGLGMATSYGIVKECGGYIGVYSEVDIGTTVKVYLPVVVSDAPGPSAPDRPAQAATRLSATILVVEDEPTVRRATVRLMKHLGCEVLVASEAAEALAVLTRKDQRIDVLFTDIVLPGMSGPELAARARDLRPDIKVLFTTGYTGDMIVRHQLAANSEEVLSKPYSSAELASKLAALL
jgi:CheY-like chemotaxis protein